MQTDELIELVKNGIQAPSADNMQPWKFKILNDQIDLFLDKEKIHNFCDEGYFSPYLSAGAAIENIGVAALQMGYKMMTHYLPEKNHPLHVANLSFSKTEPIHHPHAAAIKMRHTNRKFYQPSKRMEAALQTRLQMTVQPERDFQLLWIEKGSHHYRELTKLIGESDQLRFENQRLHKEFMQTLRISRQEIMTKDGLDYRSLEAGPGSSLLFKLISSWQRIKFLNHLGLSRMFNLYAQAQMKSSQACGLIISNEHALPHYLKGGAVMQRLWHEVTVQGLSLQPMEALPIFILMLNHTGCPGFDLKQKRELERLKVAFNSLFRLKGNEGLIFLFRIGYGLAPTARSARRDVQSFLMK